ncbi:hypothetical protein L1987_22593 [Smallanthus sonchifolius]|uniref:Uncharacterized protein n=1 Tax=Smallanthus sonchifolius TaxID=185202 RepID=A0ACB9IEJ2_9ASTR|nr:hypothetical protein L1987_22593 [Smallanthus sonchifolius]
MLTLAYNFTITSSEEVVVPDDIPTIRTQVYKKHVLILEEAIRNHLHFGDSSDDPSVIDDEDVIATFRRFTELYENMIGFFDGESPLKSSSNDDDDDDEDNENNDNNDDAPNVLTQTTEKKKLKQKNFNLSHAKPSMVKGFKRLQEEVPEVPVVEIVVVDDKGKAVMTNEDIQKFIPEIHIETGDVEINKELEAETEKERAEEIELKKKVMENIRTTYTRKSKKAKVVHEPELEIVKTPEKESPEKPKDPVITFSRNKYIPK